MTTSLFGSAMPSASPSFQNCLIIQTFSAKNADLSHFLAESRKFSDNLSKKVLKFNNLPIDFLKKIMYNSITR